MNLLQRAFKSLLSLYGGPVWDDLRFVPVASNLYSAAGRIDYNYAEGTIEFAAAADTTDYLVFVAQMSHQWSDLKTLRPHIHWLQKSANVPAWKLQWRIWPKGKAAVDWNTAVLFSAHSFAYTSGTIHQITSFPEIDLSAGGEGYGLSMILQFRVIRDSGDAADTSSDVESLLEFDLHEPRDVAGSWAEYSKLG